MKIFIFIFSKPFKINKKAFHLFGLDCYGKNKFYFEFFQAVIKVLST